MIEVRPLGAAFLPLTLAALQDAPSLADRARAAERAAEDSWYALLGDCVPGHRLPDQLRLLSEAARQYAGGGSARHRVAEFEHWVAEALDERDGEAFAEACAGYDAALAHLVVTARTRAAS